MSRPGKRFEWETFPAKGAAKNINNSDIDFCEYEGRLIINYSWGNQMGKEHLAEAVYKGSLQQFLRGWFPDDKKIRTPDEQTK